MNIGHTVKTCRKLRRFTLKELSELTDISTSHLSLIENNRREPSLVNIELISEALEIPLSVFLFLIAEKDRLKEFDEAHIDKLKGIIHELISDE